MPAPLPQPVLAPLTPAAIFLVATIDDGGEADGARRARGHRRAGARGRFPRPRQAAVGGDVDRVGRLGPAVRRSATGRVASVHRARRRPPSRAVDAGRPAVPHPRGDHGRLLRAGDQAGRGDGGRSPSSTRSTASGSSTTATCSGFVDGTENPDGPLADSATRIGDEDPDFAGGCYVHVQKYLHLMDAWNALPTEEQERVIGRTKLDDIELDDAVKPANSHVALNVIEDEDGNELKIVRHNMPFGEIGNGEFGTYFIGYSRTAAVTERMLRNMFIGDPPGNTDRMLDFSTRRHRLDVLHADHRFSRTTHRRFPIRRRTTGQSGASAPGGICGITGDRQSERTTAMNNLYRELAPITDAAWAEIEQEATRTFKRHIAGRRVVDVSEPGGPVTAASEHRSSGRCHVPGRRRRRPPARQPAAGPAAGSVHGQPNRHRRRRARIAGLGLGSGQGGRQEAGVRRGPGDLRGLRGRATSAVSASRVPARTWRCPRIPATSPT